MSPHPGSLLFLFFSRNLFFLIEANLDNGRFEPVSGKNKEKTLCLDTTIMYIYEAGRSACVPQRKIYCNPPEPKTNPKKLNTLIQKKK